MNPAADISARSIRRRMAKRCAMTSTSAYVAAWEYQGLDKPPVLHKEPLQFEYVHPTQRSYK